MKTKTLLLTLVAGLALCMPSQAADPPGILNHQGRIAVNGVNHDGDGHFKFALVTDSGATTLWSNDGTSTGGSEPTAAVTVAVSKGHYAVMLGDTTLTHMTQAVPDSVFTANGNVSLRLWFATAAGGPFELLSPDRRIASTGYAMAAGQASAVAAGGVTSEMLADGAVTSAKIASDAVTSTKIAQGAVTSATLANGAVTSAAVADGSINARDLALGATGLVRKPVLLAEVGGGEADPVIGPRSLQLDPAGSLDPTFGTGGKLNAHVDADDTAYDVAIQDDGKIVIAGHTSAPAAGYVVGRFLENGAVDSSFGTGGFTVFGDSNWNELTSLAIDEDGEVFTGGTYAPDTFVLANLLPNGSLDSSFGSGGLIYPVVGTGTNDPFGYGTGVKTVFLQADGNVVAVGTSIEVTMPPSDSGPRAIAVVRCSQNGSIDAQTIDRIGGASDLVTSVSAAGAALQSDGKIVVAGYSDINGTNDFVLLRYLSNLTIDTGFGTDGWVITDFGGADRANEVVLTDEGKIVVAGDSGGDIAIARYLSNGGLDTGFGSGGKATLDVGSSCWVRGARIDDAGRICVLGTQSGNFLLARFTAEGTPDPIFGTGGFVVTDFGGANDFAEGIAIDSQGRIVASGYTDGPDWGGDFALARHLSSAAWNGNTASLCVADEICYVVGSVAGVGNLKIIDVSAPGSPVVLTNQSHPHPILDLEGARDIYVDGDTAYLVSEEYGTLTTINVADPSNIQLLGAVGDGWAGFDQLGGAWSVAVSGSTAYVAALGDDALTIINVSNPSTPVMIAEVVDGAGGFNHLDGARDVFVDGDTAYVTATNDNALTIVDVSNPASPVLLAEVVDESGGFTKLAGAREVFVRDGIAYVTADEDDALTIIDVGNPASPVLLAEVVDGSGGFTRLDGAAGVAVSGTVAMVTSENDDAVTMIDVSDPASPAMLEEVVDGMDGFNQLDGADGICISGTMAFVASNQDQALSILDLASSVAPYAGTITHDQLGGDSVDTTNIIDGGVTVDDLAVNAVTTEKITTGAVTADKIGAAAVGGSALAEGAVTSSKLSGGSVTSSAIAVGAVGGSALADGAVTATKLSAGSVTGTAIAAGAVGGSALANGAVGVAALANEAVQTSKVANAAITAEKLAGEAVQTSKLADGAVTATKLAGEAVQSSALATGAVTATKLASEAVQTSALGAAAVTKEKMAANAVGTSQIEAAAVTEQKLAAGSVTLSKLNLGGSSGQILYNTGSATEWRDPGTVLGDESSSNELNTSLVLNGSTLELTDAGGTLTANISSLGSYQDLVLTGDVLSISDGSPASATVDLGSYFQQGASGELDMDGGAIQNVSQITAAGTPASLSISGDLNLGGSSLKSVGTIEGTGGGTNPVVLASDVNLGNQSISNVRRLGIGVSPSSESLHVASSDTAELPAVFEHTLTGGASQMHTLATLRAVTQTTASEGFGSALEFEVDDSATSPAAIGRIGASWGEDLNQDDGRLVFETFEEGVGVVEQMTLETGGELRLNGDLLIGMGAADDDDTIYFDNGDNEFLRWQENVGGGRFRFSSDLSVPNLYEDSDRDLKEHIVEIDHEDVLDRVADMPVTTWQFKEDEQGVRHMGPMAQDFHAAFGLGIDDRHIGTTDADGVAFAAIQALKRLLDEKERRIAELEERIERLENTKP